MKPTFLKVGIPKSKTRAPATVKPPTESTDATLGGDIGIYETDDGTGTTHSWVLPANAQEGDLCFIALQNESSDISTIPAGWTELLNNPAGDCSEQLYAKILEADDIAGGETFTITNSEESSTLSWYVRNTTTTPATVDVSSDSGTHDPPAVTITQGAGDYIVFPVWWANKGNFPTDQATDGPSGYTVLGAADTGGGVLAPAVYAWHANKTISTSEDPGDIAWSDSAGSRSYACVTIAVSRSGGNPTLVGFPVTASDIDSEAATDGQVLTADGSGGAAWEDSAGVSDHGALTGLTDDDHAQYVLADGTRAFTGDQSMGSNKLTNVTDPTVAQDAATKAYVDANTGSSELLMQDGVTAPPVPIETEAQDDWLYED